MIELLIISEKKKNNNKKSEFHFRPNFMTLQKQEVQFLMQSMNFLDLDKPRM